MIFLDLYTNANMDIPYFKQLLQLLALEREADRRSFLELAATTTVAQRRENGMSWYPVAIRGTEVGRGDYLTVELERTTHKDIPHRFHFGQPALFFSNHDAATQHLPGMVTFVSGDRMKISLRQEELPDWASQGKLGVDVMFDENSYQEIEAALRAAEKLVEDRKDGRLVQVLTGMVKPVFHDTTLPATAPGLNVSQQAAVQKIMAAQDLAIVHGPPGTGKTTTLVAAISLLAKNAEGQILVVAPSNTAVDLLSEKLAEAGLYVVRVGNPAKVSERLMSLTLDSRMNEHPQTKEIKKLKKQAAEYRNLAHRYKRQFGKAERDQRNALFNEARKIMKEVSTTEQYIADDILGRAQVVTATLVGAQHYTVKNRHYHTAVIDEAGQSIAPACWIPILKADRLIMAGDHKQLPPTIKSEEAAERGLKHTLMEQLVERYPEAVTLLEEQYRMHTDIMSYASQVFYDSRLKAHASVAQHLLFPDDEPILFIDTAGCGFEEEASGTSTSNPEEARFVVKHLSAFLQASRAFLPADPDFSIGIISPYKMQLHELSQTVADTPNLLPLLKQITINTVDAFQGQERDVIYISMTRSNTDGVIGFLSDIRRMNVAMTRARKKLIVVGDSATLASHPFYRDFIGYAETVGGYRSAWEWMDS